MQARQRQQQQQQLSFTLLLLLLPALSLSHCTDCCLSLSPLSSPLRLLHNNEEEGGGLTLPIGEGEGVAVGCGSSLHYN